MAVLPISNKKNNNETGNIKPKTNKEKMSDLRLQIILSFGIVIPVVLAVVISVFSSVVANALKNQTADMIQKLNTQLNSNIDSHMKTISDNINMLLTDTEIVMYNPGNDPDPEIEKEIDTKLYSYALYSTYGDYGIVYSNGNTVGKISTKLKDAGGDALFNVLNKGLSRSSGGWSSELIPGRTTAVFLRKLNDSAIAVASIDSAELTDGFEGAMFVDGMEVFIADKSLVVISSTDDDVVPGSYLKTQITRSVDRSAMSTQVGDKYVVATNLLPNGWFVITAVQTDDVLAVLNRSLNRILIITVILTFLALIYICFMAYKIAASINQTVDKLDVKAQKDLLTGIYNKRSFEEIVDSNLKDPAPDMSYALIFMDVDNFKGVNDRCGHDVGDMVLKRFAHTIDTVFRDSDIKGRLGGDEFCVLVRMPEESDRNQLISNINEVCRRFTDALHKQADSARQDLPAVTSSMGAAIWAGIPEGFEELYHKADTALYASKKRGKDTWTIHGVEK